MYGWNGQLLRVNLSNEKAKIEKYSKDFALQFMGGRGFAVKILWDEVPPGTDPLSPENKFIAAAGPIAGLLMPNVGKLVVAAKSPLTGGYGDGNLGTSAGIQLRKAGFDLLIIEGKAAKPTYLLIEDENVAFQDAGKIWGHGTIEAESSLMKEHGKNIGTLLIGQAGENLVRYAVVRSLLGRAGGRPGMGAVMGSKNLKAIAIKGSGEPAIANPEEFQKLSRDGYKDIKDKPGLPGWMTQGTMLVHEFCQAQSILPTFNFKEGQFDFAEALNGDQMEKLKEETQGCPRCTMHCGHRIHDSEGQLSELDYENVALLGSNLGVKDLRELATLNRMADDYGLDTISLGGSIAFAMEASEKGLLKDKLEWGDFQRTRQLVIDIAYRQSELGTILADGSRAAAMKLGKGAIDFAIQVKGLEVSGYDCHAAPGMALSFGTSPIGAHHKDAWVITWEIEHGREGYLEGKVDEVIRLQRIRGGMFENLVCCRFPWIEIGFDLGWYPKFFAAATGLKWALKDFYAIADRVYSLMRAYWVREAQGQWNRQMDYPPLRWFKDPLTKGPLAGSKLEKTGYDKMLSWYYERRGWDDRGIPTKKTLRAQGLEWTIPELNKVVKLN
ncbi:MAG: aldehyde ferredoxin oxidoreductase family protein [Promethearchaeota archaeon]